MARFARRARYPVLQRVLNSRSGLLVTLIFVVACVTKVGAVLLGAWTAGMPLDREAWAIGFGLNARGATGIILAGVGLAANVIDERLFVAIVIMALLTSLMSGPLMCHLLADRQPEPVRSVTPTLEVS